LFKSDFLLKFTQDVYEFPKQMVPRGTQESESEEVSCQTENDFMQENSGYFKGSHTIHNNVIIMEEMNPNLSFSSCPRSDFKVHPMKDSFGDYRQVNERGIVKFYLKILLKMCSSWKWSKV